MRAEKFRATYGPWALVTGASSGIGTEFSRQAAARGLNVVLVARREERLRTIADELRSDHGVEALTVPVDLTAPGAAEIIETRVAPLDVGLVVSNAGAALPGAFLRQPLDVRLDNLALNVTAPVDLTYRLGRRLEARGRGGLIIVSSIVGITGSPYMATYAAAKSFLLEFGRALSVEWGRHGVDVLVLAPGATRTPMADVDGVDMQAMPMPWMNPERVAAAAFRRLGRRTTVVAGRRNRVMVSAMKLMPSAAAHAMFGSMMRRVTAEPLR